MWGQFRGKLSQIVVVWVGAPRSYDHTPLSMITLVLVPKEKSVGSRMMF